MLLKSRASPDMLPSASVTGNDLKFGRRTAPLSNDTIDSVLRHREVSRTKDLSAPPRTWRDLSWDSLFKPKALKQLIGLECGALGRQTTLLDFALKRSYTNIVFFSRLVYPLVLQFLRCRNTLEKWRRVAQVRSTDRKLFTFFCSIYVG